MKNAPLLLALLAPSLLFAQEPAVNFNARMGAISGAARADRFDEVLKLAKTLKKDLIAQDPCDPQQLGWAHHYEVRANFELKKWQAALDLVEAKLTKPYAIGSTNMSYEYSIASECASRLGKPKRCQALLAKCIDLRVASNDPKSARMAVETGDVLLKGSSEGHALLTHYLETSRKQGKVGCAQAAVGLALLRQQASLQPTVTDYLVERFDALVKLARKKSSPKLLAQLARLQAKAWYQAELKTKALARLKSDAALWEASSAGDLAKIDQALKQGASADGLNLKEPTRLTPLMVAAHEGHADAVARLLKTATVDERNLAGQTALFLACSQGQTEVAKALLEAGADKDLKDAKGRTCKDAAKAHPEVLALLR